jgi:hypothetical protein
VLVALERDLLLPLAIPDPLHGHRHLLVGEKDRPRLAAPADAPGLAARATVARAGELGDLGLHHLGEGLEAQRDECLNQRDQRVEVRKLGATLHFLALRGFHLALRTDSDYARHEAAPFSGGSSVCATNRPTVRESLRYFN